MQNPNNDYIASTGTDTIAAMRFSPDDTKLAACAWSGEVQIFQINRAAIATTVPSSSFSSASSASASTSSGVGWSTAAAQVKTGVPVLSLAWSQDSKSLFYGSCDNRVHCFNIETGTQSVVAQHDAPVKEVFWISAVNHLASLSWDRSVRFWDPRASTNTPTVITPLPERVFCADARGPLMVVGLANRLCHIFDIRKPTTPYRVVETPLKQQLRSIANFPDQTGFIVASIEGRCAIQHVLEKDNGKNFAFKCHRENSEVYPCHSVSFHNGHGTFATCGGDGGFAFWDKDAKQRLRLFTRLSVPLTTGVFNHEGGLFAYASGYDWAKGAAQLDKGKIPATIYINRVDDAAVRKRR